MSTGSASIVINRPPAEVWAAIADITRMGQWSPECISGRWVGGATGPAVGAKFEGDNEAKVAGRTIKKWTTTSAVTACEPGSSFGSARVTMSGEDYSWRGGQLRADGLRVYLTGVTPFRHTLIIR